MFFYKKKKIYSIIFAVRVFREELSKKMKDKFEPRMTVDLV